MISEIDLNELRKRSLFVATPMYGAKCDGLYCKSMIQLGILCHQYGIRFHCQFMYNESLVQRARNYCADEFIRSDYTHFMFIDADIEFEAHDVISLLALSDPDDEDNEYDVICGPYPRKAIAWEKVKAAVDLGKADEDPSNLKKYVGDYVFNLKNSDSFDIRKPVEVKESGTGFMMIRRKTFDKYREVYPEQQYKPDHLRSKNFDGSNMITAYFDCVIDDDTKRYLSEDYMFCQNVTKAGMKVWICPWMRLKHQGTFVFGGSVMDLNSIGQSLTYDPKIKK